MLAHSGFFVHYGERGAGNKIEGRCRKSSGVVLFGTREYETAYIWINIYNIDTLNSAIIEFLMKLN